MKIPKVDRGILSSILVEIDGPQKDPDWVKNMLTRLKISNPVIADYIVILKDKNGERAALAGLIVYRIIESQMEADELEELFQ